MNIQYDDISDELFIYQIVIITIVTCVNMDLQKGM